jgi:hypothetical protein
MAMPRVPGDVPQVPFQPTQMPGFAAPTAQPTQDPFPQQLQQLAAGLQDVGQASSRIGSAVQRQAATEQEQAAREQERQKIIRQKEQDKLDETSASDAFNQFRIFVTPKRTEFGKLEGKDAASSYSKFVKEIADKGDEIEKGLANEMQRALFRKSRMLYELDVVNAMDVHAFQENRNYQANTRKSSAELNSQAYTESVMDSIKQKRADEFQQKMADTYGIGLPKQSMRIQPEAYKSAMASDIREAMRGQPDEAIEVQVRSAFGVMHKNTLELLASKKEFEAISSYIDANEKEIDPKVVIDYRKMASSAKIDFDATKFAIQLSAKLREKDGFVREEDYSATMSYLDVFYDSKKSGWTEEQYKAIKSAMLSIKQADDGLRSKARSDAISEAKGLIDILKSPDARAAYAQGQSQAGVDPNVYGPTQRPAVVPIISDETAEDAFRQSFPVQYAKLERLGLLDDLKEHLAGGGKSDDNALREIETDSLKDPSYYAKYPLDQFAARYGLRLSTKDFNIHFDKILAAQAKAGEKASVLSTEDEGILLRKALIDNGIIDAASGKDKDEEIPASSVSFNVKQKWSEFTAAYKQKNAGENPNRTEYKKFLDDFFQDAKVYGDQYKIGKQSAEDLDKTFVSFETSVGGQPKKFSAQFSKIDKSLVQMAQASIEDDNNKRFRVVVDTDIGPISLYPRFATESQAVEFAGTQQARDLIKEFESTSGRKAKAIYTDQDQYVDPQSDRVAVGQRALQIVANKGYASEDGTPLQYDSNRRADFIATQYGSAKSEVGVPQGFLGNYFDFMTQPFKAGDWMSWDDAQKAYMQSKQVAFDAMKARVETLRDDINSDNYNPGQIIDSKTASMLTGYTEEELINIGAATMVKRIVPTEFGTKTFNEPILKVGGIAKYVKENYDLVTSKLKKDGIRQ